MNNGKKVTGDITKEQLIELVKSEDIDTIIMGFCDMQGLSLIHI